MSSLWVIHFMKYIKTQLEAQGRKLYFQLDKNHRQ